MKITLVFAAWILGIAAARAEVVFQGYMTTPAGSWFVLSVEKEKASGWLAIGQQFNGVAVIAFDARAEALTVEQDGKRKTLHLAEGRTPAAPGAHEGAAIKPIIISIGDSESIAVGDDAAMLDALKKKFEQVAAMKPQPIITLRAPGEASFERVRQILDLMRKTGITRFQISTP